MRWLMKIVLVLVVLVLAVGAFFAYRIGPRNIIGMLRYDQRREGTLQVGDQAPDVAMIAPDGTSEVRLRDHVGAKPLILIFGSYT